MSKARIAELESQVERAEKERDEAKRRIDELLATIVQISRETPYPDELKEWETQRGAMIAEVGTLRSQLRHGSAREAPERVRLLEAVVEAYRRGGDARARMDALAALDAYDHNNGGRK